MKIIVEYNSKNMLKYICMSLLGATAAKITVDQATRTFRDELGRARIFHGFNAVVKLPEYIPTTDQFDW